MEVVHNDAVAIALGVAWLVAMTNAFNLLDNMDGLAASLAAIACTFFAIDAATEHPSRLGLVLALALGLGCLGFLPFNVRPGRPAAVFMGDSGSQLIGFMLASLGLLTSWKVARSTIATLMLPLVLLAIPILDTALVTVTRLLEGRPIYQGGRDHTSHRLVYRGLSEKRAVVLLSLIAAGLGASSLAYTILDDSRVTLAGVLVTFALLVQFAGFLAAEGAPREVVMPAGGPLRTLILHRRRLIEAIVDFALITASFLAAYLLVVKGSGTANQRHLFNTALPVILTARYLFFLLFGLYRGVWRYASTNEASRVIAAVTTSELAAFGFLALTAARSATSRSRSSSIDGLICTVLVGALALRGADARPPRRGAEGPRRPPAHADRRRRPRRPEPAARAAREPGRARRRLRRRRPAPPPSAAPGRARPRRLPRHRVDPRHAQPDAVLVTIPSAPRDRLDAVVRACARAQSPLPLRPARDRPRPEGHPRRFRRVSVAPATAPRPLLDRLLGIPAGRPRVPLPDDPLRVGVARPQDAVALRRRAGPRADLALDPGDGARGAPRRGAHVPDALRVPARAGVVARRHAPRLLDREVHRRRRR